MRGVAILNRESGGLRRLDPDRLAKRLTDAFAKNGHTIEARVITGSELDVTLREIAGDDGTDFVVAAGGDGTLSAIARLAFETHKVLGVLPGGTMNLYSRSLGMPQNLMEACDAIASAEVRNLDIATANGQPFLHQFSVGLHPRLVRTRQKLRYNSRIGKMLASIRAFLMIASRPPRFIAEIDTGGRVRKETLSLVAVSNNFFGDGHLPYADRLDEGILGLYCVSVLDERRNFKLTTDMLRGAWRDNPDVASERCSSVRLRFEDVSHKARCVIDGELMPFDTDMTIAMHAGDLRVLVPKGSPAAG